jgi:hypothetical protein
MKTPNPSTPEATRPATKLMRYVTFDGVVVITEADDPHRDWFGEVSDAEEHWSLDERFVHADLIIRAVNSYDDMLSALKAMVNDAAFADLCQSIGEEPDWLKNARAAIAKAERAQ